MEFAKNGMVNAIILVDNEVKIMKQLLQASSQNHPTKCMVYNITRISMQYKDKYYSVHQVVSDDKYIIHW